jgi:hypothetical protein
MAHHDKLLMDFLKSQHMLMGPLGSPTTAATKRKLKASNKIMDPSVHAKPEVDMAFIIEKKPKGKKVLEFLQKEIDAIMAEAEA